MSTLLPCWAERIETADPESDLPQRARWQGLPVAAQTRETRITVVTTCREAEEMAEFAGQRPLSHIGIDTEFKYDRPPVVIDRKNEHYDPAAIHPLLLSLSMVEVHDGGDVSIYRYVVDLGCPEVYEPLASVLRMPACFCGHHLKVEFFCLMRLGLPVPRTVWDTFIAEKALHLGRHRARKNGTKKSDPAAAAKAREEAEDKQTFGYSLLVTCQRYGISHDLGPQKERLQQSFLEHEDGAPYTEEQISYAAEDATAAAMLYPQQVAAATKSGTLQHLVNVEMPWVETNAAIEWNGVRIDLDKRDRYKSSISTMKHQLSAHLRVEYGLSSVDSHAQLMEFFTRVGIIENFKARDSYSFDREALKRNEGLHPAVGIIRMTRRAGEILGDAIMNDEFVGCDGRMHPDHRQLGTDTGRQVTRFPNLLGLDGVLRPVIIPAEGYGIGEVDYAQVEVGIAGAVYHDEALVQMFNTGDVYSAMAQQFFQGELSEEERHLPGGDFKRQRAEMRRRMKSCTLGIIYGMTPEGLARDLGCPVLDARHLMEDFMDMFPTLRRALDVNAAHSALRGYATTIDSLRRYLPVGSVATRLDRNWMVNHPVQGSAAVVFKAAGNRLHRLYSRYGARLIIPVHDAFVFEAPIDRLQEVADLTVRVMCNTLQEYFPVLEPGAEVNIVRPECWNKDGETDPLSSFIDRAEKMLQNWQ